MLTLGLPRMHKEQGERRDFLPDLVRAAVDAGAAIVLEKGVGAGMGVAEQEYVAAARGRLRVVETREEAWQQDVVLVLRSPEVEEFDQLVRQSSTVVSMLHLPTRPRRVEKLRSLGAAAVSLDGLVDDDGRRLVENLRAVGWNGLHCAFSALQETAPWRLQPGAPVIRVTVLGSGRVGRQAVAAAIKYGDRARWEQWSAQAVPPVTATAIGRRLTADAAFLQLQFSTTDVLVDATQRQRPDVPVVSNELLQALPAHAVICDLNVDPYDPLGTPPTVRSIEGIPMGNLDRWLFRPDDADWAASIPADVPTRHRRTVVSCYSWPGIKPKECMAHYGRQLAPLLARLIERGGGKQLSASGDALDRALWRSGLETAARHTPIEPVEPIEPIEPIEPEPIKTPRRRQVRN